MNLGRNFIVFDVETSTRDEETASLIQLGAVMLSPDFKRIGQFNAFIKPYTPHWDMQAQNCHGITREFLETNGLQPAEAVRNFEQWVGNDYDRFYLGHWSSQLDINMLKGLYKHVNVEYKFCRRTFDIASFVRLYLAANNKLSEKGYKVGLVHCAEALGLEIDKDRTHDGLYDAHVTVDELLATLERVVHEKHS